MLLGGRMIDLSMIDLSMIDLKNHLRKHHPCKKKVKAFFLHKQIEDATSKVTWIDENTTAVACFLIDYESGGTRLKLKQFSPLFHRLHLQVQPHNTTPV